MASNNHPNWNQALDAQLKIMGFKQSASDPCICTSTSDGLFILAVYVDDILLAGRSQRKIAQVKAALGKLFQVKDIGELHYFLGVSVKQNSESGETWISQLAHTQAGYSREVWTVHCKPINTPVTPGTKLLKVTEQSNMVDATLYQSVVHSTAYTICLDGLDLTLHLPFIVLSGSVPQNIGQRSNVF